MLWGKFRTPADITRLERLENRLDELTRRVDTAFDNIGSLAALKGKVDALGVNWETERLALAELYDKAYHMLQRHAKRQRDAERAEEPDNGGAPAVIVDPVSERVLARRRGERAVSPVVPR